MEFIASQGVRCAALTDHDTLNGLAEAQLRADQLGVHLVSGIELSSQWLGRDIHILGLDVTPNSTPLLEAIAERGQIRKKRMREIISRLERHGVRLSNPACVTDRAVPTRTHLAQLLVDEGVCSSLALAFKQFLGHQGVARVACAWPSLVETVTAIVAAGGIAVMAHPLRYQLSAGQRRQLLKEFKHHGGEGLEAVSGGMSPAALETAKNLALRAELKASRGSDCHNPTLPWHQPSRLAKLHPSLTPLWVSVDESKGAA